MVVSPCTILLQVHAGTQAAVQHPQLAPKLCLRSIGGRSVVGRSYEEVMEMLRAAGRPLRLAFARPGESGEAAAARTLDPQATPTPDAKINASESDSESEGEFE